MDGTPDKMTLRTVVVPLRQDRPPDEALAVAAHAERIDQYWAAEVAGREPRSGRRVGQSMEHHDAAVSGMAASALIPNRRLTDSALSGPDA